MSRNDNNSTPVVLKKIVSGPPVSRNTLGNLNGRKKMLEEYLRLLESSKSSS